MSRFLITGGAGFIGSHLVDLLLQKNYQVTVLDNLSAGSLDNLSIYEDKISFIKGDVRKKKDVVHAIKGCDYVLHHAAISLVGPTIENPTLAHEVNVGGTLNVLQSAREGKVKRFVQASSAAVYGNRQGSIRCETDMMELLTPYAATKAAAEHYARVYHRLYGLETVSLRYFNVYGPRQDSQTEHASALAVFVKQILAGEVPQIHGDGTQSRDFIFVKDVCMANLKAVLATNKQVPGSSYNIGSGKTTTIKGLLSTVNKVMNKDVDHTDGESRLGDVKHSKADISLANKELDWYPRVDLQEGIKAFVKWYESEIKVAQKERV